VAIVSITDVGLTTAQALLHDLGNYEEPTIPFLLVRWIPAATENRRGLRGEAIWEQVGTAHWAAEVAGWAETPERSFAEHTLQVRGLRLMLDTRAEKANGELVVDAIDGNLTVSHRFRTPGVPPAANNEA
jgi:hypothetical protein